MPENLIEPPIPEEGRWEDGAPVIEPDSITSEYGIAATNGSHTPNPESMGTRIRLRDLLDFVPTEDKDSILGNRYLCRGGSCVIVAQTSAGKSSLGMQMAVVFALGLPFFGLKPRKPLKSIIVQAENDLGDTAEMFQGVLLGMGLISTDDIEGANALMEV